jgi:hypothetical protein
MDTKDTKALGSNSIVFLVSFVVNVFGLGQAKRAVGPGTRETKRLCELRVLSGQRTFQRPAFVI